MRPRRCLLFMPGDDLKKIQKGSSLGVDSIVMDLEDGVALNRKVEARATIANALRDLDFGRAERVVRLNPIGSGLEQDDLAAVLQQPPDSLMLPKVETVDQVQWLDRQLVEGGPKLPRHRRLHPLEPVLITCASSSAKPRSGSGSAGAHPPSGSRR